MKCTILNSAWNIIAMAALKEENARRWKEMANEKNLIPQSMRSQRERKEIARMGAIASNAKQKARRTLREELLALLENGDTQERLSLAQIQKALNGDTKAFEVIRDTIGEKPTDKVETSGDQTISIKIDGDVSSWSK